MINAILCGASGKMGGFVANAAIEDGSFRIVAGVDKVNCGQPFPIFSRFGDINVEADVLIDFSNPVLLDSMLEYAIDKKLPVVIATTGYSDTQIEKIKAASDYAESIGLQFQIVDDILDVTSTTDVLGKPVNSDLENNKTNMVSLMGIDRCRELARNLTDIAKESLKAFDGDTKDLEDFAESLLIRHK